ncbi:MAG TPA: hypothetical protein VKB86_19720 [Pyrinomonadaceae bacterium]|nr:hypothetical protein [Pyrinomonadaceae bacterium]
MRRIKITARFRAIKRLAFYLCLCGVILFQGCSRGNDVTQFGSHKITVEPKGVTHSSYIEEHDKEASYHYSSYGLTGHYEVVIKDDEVIVNGKSYGQLNKGDAVKISDNGVTVNSMSVAETAKYLQTNSEQARP